MSNRKGTRFLACVLCLVMLLGLMPGMAIPAYAEPVASFTVTVTDGAAPVSGASVTLTGESGSKTAVTDAQGKADFADFVEPGGVYTVKASLEGYQDGEGSFTADEATLADGYALQLTALTPKTVSGTVTAKSTGRAINGATVKLLESGSEVASVTTGTDGKFSFKAYEEKSYTLTVTAEGYEDQTLENDQLGANLKISLTAKTVKITTTVNGKASNKDFGAIKVSPSTVSYGAKAKLTITAAKTGGKQYVLIGLRDNGEAVKGEYLGKTSFEYTIDKVTEDHAIAADFALDKSGFDGSFTVDGNGVPDIGKSLPGSLEVSPIKDGADDTVIVGYQVSYQAPEHYIVKSAKVDGEAQEGYPNDNGIFTYRFDVPITEAELKNKHSFALEVELKSYQFTLDLQRPEDLSQEEFDALQVTVDPEDGVVPHEGTLTLTIPTVDGFFYKVSKDGEDLTAQVAADGTLKFEKVKAAFTVTVVYQRIETQAEAEGDLAITATNEISGLGDPNNRVYYVKNFPGGSVTLKSNKGYQISLTSTNFADSVTLNETTVVEKVFVQIDGAPVELTLSPAVTVKRDTKAPTVAVKDQEVTDWVIIASTTVYGTAHDNSDASGETGIDRVVFTKTAGLSDDQIRALGTNSTATLESDGSFSASFNGRQKNKYYFYAIDKAGNVSDASNKTVLIDEQNPVVKQFSANSSQYKETSFGIFSNHEIDFAVECTDDMSGIKDVEIYQDDKLILTLHEQKDYNSSYPTDSYLDFKLSPENFTTGRIFAVAIDESGKRSEKVEMVKNNSNISYDDVQFMIETTAPSFQITLGENAGYDGTWFKGTDDEGNARLIEVTVKISDEQSGLDLGQDPSAYASVAQDWILLDSAVLLKNDPNHPITCTATRVETKTVVENQTNEDGTVTPVNKEVPTGKVFEAELKFTIQLNASQSGIADAGVDIQAKDNAGNQTQKDSGEKAEFKIDAAAPAVSLFLVAGKEAGLVQETTYGYFFQEATLVRAKATDEGSGVKTIIFTLVDAEGNETGDTLPAIADAQGGGWYVEVLVPAGFKGQVYARALDQVGNESENVKPNGIVNETPDQHDGETHVEVTLPETENKDEKGYALFALDEEQKSVDVTVTVTDTVSGIASVEWAVIPFFSEERMKDEETKIDWNKLTMDPAAAPELPEGWETVTTDSNLVTQIKGVIPVDTEANGIAVAVIMTDNAGYSSSNVIFQGKTITQVADVFSIDNTAPVLELSHVPGVEKFEKDQSPELGSVGTSGKTDVATGKYTKSTPLYNASHSLVVKITDQNLNEQLLRQTFQTVFADGEQAGIKGKDDGFTWVLKNANPKDIKATGDAAELKIFGPFYDGPKDETDKTVVRKEAKYPYTEGAYYLVLIPRLTEEAAGGTYEVQFNCTDMAAHAGNKVADDFTIDTTKPTITITYDNNEAENGNYYKAPRTATVTVTERNFAPDKFAFTGSATDDGRAIQFPTNGGWTNNGTVHVTTVEFKSDAYYSNMSVKCTDLAGNEGQAETPAPFYVDQTLPKITITGVEDKSANRDKVAPEIEYSDTNIDLKTLEITLTGVNNGVVDYAAVKKAIHNGEQYIYSDFEHKKPVDDIYTLYIKLKDKAGNESVETITFSCNRFGSVFDLSQIEDMLGKFNQQERDLVIVETNVDPIDPKKTRIILTKNGVPVDLEQGKDYTMTESGGDGTWSHYTYVINKELFADDGTYSLYIYTEDAAGNINENIDATRDAQISFGIDKTKPIVNPIDLADGVQYPVEGKTVTVEIKDNLQLNSVKIYLNGEEVPYRLEGENYVFDIPMSNSKQSVTIVAVDAAGNEEEILVKDFLVTTNLFYRWLNNTPLFVGSMVGMGVLTGLLIWWIIILFKRRKDDEEEEQSA